MAKRWSVNVWNDWCWIRPDQVDVTLFRLGFDCQRDEFVSADLVVLGFGVSVTRYADRRTEAWYAREPEA